MPVGKPTLNNAAIRHALRSLHAGSGAAHAAEFPLLVAPPPAYGEREQVEHVALLIKNTRTCSTCTVSQNHPYVIAGNHYHHRHARPLGRASTSLPRPKTRMA